MLALLMAGAIAASAPAEPPLTVSRPKLAAALHCTAGVDHAQRTPLMLVTGTGASGGEAYAIGKGALDAAGLPVCYVDFPHFTTGDMQIAVQYLVYGVRTMAKRAGRKVAVLGISQGGVPPPGALACGRSLRAEVSAVIAAAGTQHGTTGFAPAVCKP